ncbi:MAG: COX15/CtaA family protein [Methylococcus sp.]
MFRAITLFALTLTLFTIGLGTFIHTADSGLGCPQWPGCVGKPMSEIVSANTPSFNPASEEKMARVRIDIRSHRLMAGWVCLSILILSSWVWALRQHRMRATVLIMISLAVVIAQAMLGIFTLNHSLLPVAVASHVLLGFLILLLLFLLLVTVRASKSPPVATSPLTFRFQAWLGLLLVMGQLALGGWASAHYAGLACPEFPGCQGLTWADFDFRGGFAINLDSDPGEARTLLPLKARAAIHWAHRMVGLVTWLLLTLLAIMMAANKHSRHVQRTGVGLALLIQIQTGSGIAAILMRLPLVIEVLHAIMAGLLLMMMAYIGIVLSRQADESR